MNSVSETSASTYSRRVGHAGALKPQSARTSTLFGLSKNRTSWIAWRTRSRRSKRIKKVDILCFLRMPGQRSYLLLKEGLPLWLLPPAFCLQRNFRRFGACRIGVNASSVAS